MSQLDGGGDDVRWPYLNHALALAREINPQSTIMGEMRKYRQQLFADIYMNGQSWMCGLQITGHVPAARWVRGRALRYTESEQALYRQLKQLKRRVAQTPELAQLGTLLAEHQKTVAVMRTAFRTAKKAWHDRE